MGVSSKKKRIWINVLIHFVLILLLLICLLPIALVVINAFKTNAEIVRNPLSIPKVLHLENFIQAWTTGKFAHGFINSIKLSGCTILIILVCSTLAGYVLSGYRIKGSGIILTYFMMAMTVPIQLFLFPLYYAFAKLNLIGNIPATSLILSAMFMPLSVFLMRTFFLNVPKELEDAARIDGANEFYIFHKIVIPMSKNGISSIAIFQFLWAWEDFLWPYLVIDDSRKQLLSVGLKMFNGQYSTDYGALFAATTISIIPVLAVYLFFQKQFIAGIAASAVKG